MVFAGKNRPDCSPKAVKGDVWCFLSMQLLGRNDKKKRKKSNNVRFAFGCCSPMVEKWERKKVEKRSFSVQFFDFSVFRILRVFGCFGRGTAFEFSILTCIFFYFSAASGFYSIFSCLLISCHGTVFLFSIFRYQFILHCLFFPRIRRDHVRRLRALQQELKILFSCLNDFCGIWRPLCCPPRAP